MKECKCKEHEGDRLLSEDNFGKNKRCADGLDYFCKSCRSAYHKKLYANNAVSVNERVSKWQSAHKEQVNNTSKRYRERNAEKRKEITKRWREKNKALTCALANQRRANKCQATPGWSEIEAIRQLYESCPTGSHVHHIVPLQEDSNVCGLHCMSNLVILPVDIHNHIHSSIDVLRETYDKPSITLMIE